MSDYESRQCDTFSKFGIMGLYILGGNDEAFSDTHGSYQSAQKIVMNHEKNHSKWRLLASTQVK